MSDSLFDLLTPSPAEANGRLFGVVVGVVTNNQDPENLGRVKVRFPWLSDDAESYWARVVSPMAGDQRGLYFLPEVEDEVLVAFLNGQPDAPVVLGGMWNGKDKAPADNSDGENNLRLIRSRSGHLVRFDDTDGKEKIEIVDKSGKNKIVIDSAANTVTISADADVSLQSANGKISVSGASVEIKSTQGAVEISSSAAATIKAQADLAIQGQTVNIN